jgi:hypothetical protein
MLIPQELQLSRKTVSLLRSKQNSTYRGMTFIYFVTNSAWNPNTWAILCGILAVFLIVVLLTIYFIFRRLHIDLTILRTVFQEQKRPSHPATLTISDIPPGSETAIYLKFRLPQPKQRSNIPY